MNRYADLHFHPAHSAYNKVRMTPEENNPETNHPWNIPPSNLKKQKKGKQAFKYNQCDFAQCQEAGVKLAFASLYPIEKGFFFGRGGRAVWDLTKKKREKDGTFNFFDLIGAMTKYIGYLFPIRSFFSNIALDYIQSLSMRFSFGRVQFIQSAAYDYYEELKREYLFYLNKDGVKHPITIKLKEDEPIKTIKGEYNLVKNKDHLTKLIAENKTAVIFTIEGMHALGIGNTEKNVKDADMPILKERIRELKGLKGDTWKHPILFITYSHHFNNQLCGHAHSFPKIAELLADQKFNMNLGIVKNDKYNGLEIMKSLLGLDEKLNADESPRILIDVKHMSARGRVEYYANIVKPYNNKAKAGDKKLIPVIASHVGHSGHATLAEQIEDLHKENDNHKRDGFYAWNINICDEDVRIIHESEGLIGMSFDQRILGVGKKFLFFNLKGKRKNDIYRFIKMIKRIVGFVFESELENKDEIWKRICIGSDFEGFVDPVNTYPTVLYYPGFELDLTEEMNILYNEKPEYFKKYNVNQIINNIMFDNAYHFAIKHLNN